MRLFSALRRSPQLRAKRRGRLQLLDSGVHSLSLDDFDCFFTGFTRDSLVGPVEELCCYVEDTSNSVLPSRRLKS
jgi:hypothetical protein